MNFTFDNQGTNSFLVYELLPDETLDTVGLGMIRNNDIENVLRISFTQMDEQRYLRYNISSKISLDNFFTGVVTQKRLLNAFMGICNAIEDGGAYMLETNLFVLDSKYIFANVATGEVSLVYLPVLQQQKDLDLCMFFKQIMFSTQFDPSEDCGYVAKIINFLNTSNNFSLSDFKKLLLMLKNQAEDAANMAKKQGANKVVGGSYVVNPAPVAQPAPRKPAPPVHAQPAAPAVKPAAPKPAPAAHTPPVPSMGGMAVPPPAGKLSGFQKPAMKPIASQPGTPLAPASAPAPAAAPVAEKHKKSGFSLFGKKKETEEKTEPKPALSGSFGFAVPGMSQNDTPAPAPFAAPSAPAAQPKPAQPHKLASPAPAPQPAVHSHAVPPAPRGVSNNSSIPEFMRQKMGSSCSETTLLGGQNIAGTTVLGGGVSAGATTVLSAAPMQQQQPQEAMLYRSKTGESVTINKILFRIGTEASFVDYCVKGNGAISHSHADIVKKGEDYYIRDNHSTNHTYVNGNMIVGEEEHLLMDGDQILLANEQFTFEMN